MTDADRELLELAAKAMIAAGQSLLWTKNHDEPEPYWMLDFEPWRPREDDGHALRMAAALRIGIAFSLVDGSPTAYRDRKYQQVGCHEPAGDDLEAATRLAILRAAAEIGRALP